MIKEVEKAIEEKGLKWNSYEELVTGKKSTNTLKRKFSRRLDKVKELNELLEPLDLKIDIVKNVIAVLLMVLIVLPGCTKEVIIDGCETCVVETLSNENFVCGLSQEAREVIATKELGEACTLQEVQAFIDKYERVRSYTACGTMVFSNNVVKCTK